MMFSLRISLGQWTYEKFKIQGAAGFEVWPDGSNLSKLDLAHSQPRDPETAYRRRLRNIWMEFSIRYPGFASDRAK